MANPNADVATALLTAIFNMPTNRALYTMKMPKQGDAQGSHLKCLAIHENKIMDITPAVAAILDKKLTRKGTIYLNAVNDLARQVSQKLFGKTDRIEAGSI